jgi:hypothetical protein
MFEMEDENDNQSRGSILEVNLDIAQAVAFATRSKAVVNAGRLPCTILFNSHRSKGSSMSESKWLQTLNT